MFDSTAMTLIQLFLQWFPPLLASLLIFIGLIVAIRPLFAAKMYGVPTQDPSFVIAAGMRDIALGWIVFAIWHLDRPAVMANTMIGIAIVPLADVVISRRAGAKLPVVAQHALGFIACVVYALIVFWLEFRV